MRACRHATWVVRPFAPQGRLGRHFAYLRAVGATLRRKPIAHAVGSICRRRVEQKHRCDEEDLGEGSHRGEVKV